MRIAGEQVLPSLVTDGDLAGLGSDIFKQNVIKDKGMTIRELEEAEKRRRYMELMEQLRQRSGPGETMRGV